MTSPGRCLVPGCGGMLRDTTDGNGRAFAYCGECAHRVEQLRTLRGFRARPAPAAAPAPPRVLAARPPVVSIPRATKPRPPAPPARPKRTTPTLGALILGELARAAPSEANAVTAERLAQALGRPLPSIRVWFAQHRIRHPRLRRVRAEKGRGGAYSYWYVA